MFTRTITFFLCVFTLTMGLFINAERVETSTNEHMKYNLSICSVFNNEAYHLKEWIEYHQKLGVEHFYLYNNGSKDHFMFVLIPFMNDGMVTLVNWPGYPKTDDMDAQTWALSTQVPAFENAVNFVAKEETKWLMIVDIDEFVVCPQGNLAELLLDYDDYPGITLVSETYDGSTLVKSLPNITLLDPEESEMDQGIYVKAAKTIFKPDLCTGFMWPPYLCRLKSDLPIVQADSKELRVNHYINRSKTPETIKKKIHHTPQSGVQNISETTKIESFHFGFESDNQHLPLYNCMPGFLQRLQNKMNEKAKWLKS